MTDLEIYLSKSSKILLPHASPSKEKNTLLVSTFNRNIESLGFTFSKKLMTAMGSLSNSQINELYTQIVPLLKKMVGANKAHKPMYPNFPEQVMEMSDFELYTNAMMHYMGSDLADTLKVPVRILPNYDKKDRKKLDEDEIVELKVIDLGSEKDFNAVFTRLLSANGSLSESDKGIVEHFVVNKDFSKLVPETIPQKENLGFFIGKAVNNGKKIDFSPYLKTATDVLRIIVSMSEGDVSLAKPTKFRNLKRKERLFVFEALSKAENFSLEDMNRWREYWKRVASVVHPSDFQKRYPEIVAAFNKICSDETIDTFNSRIEKCLATTSVDGAIANCVERPGDFGRRLDKMLRLFSEQSARIVEQFGKVCDKVSTPVLLQMYHHFDNRNNRPYRAFFPKGNVAKMQLSEEKLPEISKEILDSVSALTRNCLVKRFSKLEKLGKVYIDPALKDCIVPFSQRSASKTLKTLARGSKIELIDCSVLRFFCWWKDGTSRTDIDLSASLYDNNWHKVSDVAYYNLKEFGGCHSGDITSAPNGASEFIDLDIKKLKERGIRYIQMSLYSYTNQPYKDLPECFAGWMARKEAGSGEIYEPRTVANKVDITSEDTACVPLIIDLVENKVIWTDLSFTNRMGMTGNNSLSGAKTVKGIAQVMCELNKPNLYELFAMHVEGRGTLVESKEEADFVFSMNSGVTPYDIDVILSTYLV